MLVRTDASFDVTGYSMQPQASDLSRMCLNFSRDGLNVYANRQALLDLRDQLTWIIESPEDDPYHLHVLMALENDASKFDGKRPRNAGMAFDEDASEMREADIDGGEVVDLSFFLVGDSLLDEMQVRQK